MQHEKIEHLLERYHNGIATNEERALVESWYLKYEPVLKELPAGQLEEDQKQSLESFMEEFGHARKRNLWPVIAAAASLLIFMSVGGYFLLHTKTQQPPYAIHQHHKQDLPPGGNKATLTLANGSVIVLTDAKNGMLANQGNTQINKTSDGHISYAGKNEGGVNTIVYNTATTPRGGQYQFILADGTKVWLNASSSLKFPVAFVGNERKVELTGEAYFEVVHDAAKPFRVVTNGQTIEDIGTHFNINAYSDESAIKTTLLEGSVRISTENQNRIIKPGEQVQFTNGAFKVSNVDVEEVVAWKNGFFNFDDSSIQDVTRQLSRWYDVDIRYEGQIPARHFSGQLSRNVNASQLLDVLTFKKIHYRIEGKAIVIQP